MEIISGEIQRTTTKRQDRSKANLTKDGYLKSRPVCNVSVVFRRRVSKWPVLVKRSISIFVDHNHLVQE